MRLVSVAPSNTEIAWSLGLADSLVGVDDWSDFPPELAERVRRGEVARLGPDLQIDCDRVASLRPDAVLASLSVPGMEQVVTGLTERGLPVLVLNPLRLCDVFQNIRDAAAFLGVPERGDRVAGDLERRVEAVRQRADRVQRDLEREGRPAPRRAFWEWWPKPLITPGRDSWVNDLLGVLGIRQVYDDLPATSAPVDPQEVPLRQPDVIAMCWCGSLQSRMSAERVRARSGWEDVPAVREGRILALPESLFGRPGPRLVDGLEMLAERIGLV